MSAVFSSYNYSYTWQYSPDNDGRFPLRYKGEPLMFTPDTLISPVSTTGKYRIEAVAPFLSRTTNEAERKALFHDRLQVATYTKEDLPTLPSRAVCEKALIGFDKVVAKKRIPPGDCLGVFAGNIISATFNDIKYEPGTKGLTHYSLIIGDDHIVLGDGILSRINSVFEYDATQGYRQARQGYNVEMAFFATVLPTHGGEKIYIPAMFALHEIEEGEEVRWNYGYSSELITARLAPEMPQQNDTHATPVFSQSLF